jgi:hypothetical protein
MNESTDCQQRRLGTPCELQHDCIGEARSRAPQADWHSLPPSSASIAASNM